MSNPIEGFLLINKPTGVTSYYCINKLKRCLGFRTKIGHAGTLDSFATGLLIIGIGRSATRQLGTIMKLDKWYIATAKLGQLTDTLDFTGNLLEDKDTQQYSIEHISSAIKGIGHQYCQTPPIYSALKYEGRALSDLAREKKLTEKQLHTIVQKKSKMVNIYSCELLSIHLPFFTIKAHVSHGTYIRVLISDIALKLGTYGTTHELHRTNIGPFSVQKASPLIDFRTIDDIDRKLITLDAMAHHLSKSKALPSL